MTDATELDEASIRARLEAATPGPWEAHEDDTSAFGEWVIWMPDAGCDQALVEHAADAEFIAHAHTDVGLLLTALDEARADFSREFARGMDLDTELVDVRIARDKALARAEAARAQVERLHFDLDREARARQAAEGALAAVRALADELSAEIDELRDDLPPKGPGRVAHMYRTAGLSEARDRLRAALATPTTTDAPTCTCVVGVCREDDEDGCCESPHCPATPATTEEPS